MSGRKIAVLTFAAAAVLACDNEPLNVESRTASSALAPQFSSAKAEQDIQALVDAQFAAWSAKDAAAHAATYEIDAKFFDPAGAVHEGRAAIFAAHAFLFGAFFAGTTETQVITGVRFLTGTIAIVYLNAELTGFGPLPPGFPLTEPGVLRTTKTWVVVKRAGSWEIVTQHMAPVAPAP
jgi:uncharacterized protein (TIGR02246 family)